MRFKLINENKLQERIYNNEVIIDDATGEVLFETSRELIKCVRNEFMNFSSEQDILDLLGGEGEVDDSNFDFIGAAFITPSGKLISVDDALIGSGCTHMDIIYYLVDQIYLKVTHQEIGSIDEINHISHYMFDDLLNVLTTKYGWIRCNTGQGYVDNRFYCVLTSNNPKGCQWAVLQNWMEWGEVHKNKVLVFFGVDGRNNKIYEFIGGGGYYTADDVIKLMKRYYSSGGCLYEKK